MEASHVELWNASLPDRLRSSSLFEKERNRKKLVRQHGSHVPNAVSVDQPPNWKARFLMHQTRNSIMHAVLFAASEAISC